MEGTRTVVSCEVVRSKIQRPRRDKESVVKRRIVGARGGVEAGEFGERVQRTRMTGIWVGISWLDCLLK